MSFVSSINGIDFEGFKLSYTLTCLIEKLFTDYYKIDDEEKLQLFNQFDKEISEKLNMPRANFVFENKEFTLDTENLYFGKLRDIKSGYEFICRYFFEKRQQYQRLCIANNDQKNFSEQEFEDMKEAYDLLPLTKKNNYIPYKKGLEKYMGNYNKMDAMLYMFDCSVCCLKMVDYQRILEGMSKNERERFISSLDRCEMFADKFSTILSSFGKEDKIKECLCRHYDEFKVLKLKEMYLISQITSLMVLENPAYNEGVLLCFHENVWGNLDIETKKLCVEIANLLISNILGCNVYKDISYARGRNSYNFGNEANVYLGDITKCSARDIICKLVYEYSFIKVYKESICLLDEYMINEYEKCKEIYEKNKGYDEILDSDFIKDVRFLAIRLQTDIYNYISKNLKIDGKKIEMPMKKNEFVYDLFKKSNKRR